VAIVSSVVTPARKKLPISFVISEIRRDVRESKAREQKETVLTVLIVEYNFLIRSIGKI